MLPLLLPAIGALGSVFGGAAKGSANQRRGENDDALRAQQLAQQQSRDTFGAGMQGAHFDREGQDRQRRAQILMQLLNNTQDAQITPGNPAIAARMPRMTGGNRPSNLTTNREALMQLLMAPQTSAPQYQAPPPLNMQRPGRGENILGGLGLGSSILSVLGGLFGNGQPRPQGQNQELHV